MNEYRNIRTCTSCCPFDAKKLLHPQFNYSDIKENGLITNLDACCLNKLQVDCHIQCQKKKKKRHNSIYSSQSTKRSISSSSSNKKRKKFSSHNIHNYDSDSQTSSEQSYSSKDYRHYNKSTNAEQYHRKNQSDINQNIRDLKNSIDNLTQLIVHQQNSSRTNLLSNQLIPIPSLSFIDKFRRFLTLFKTSSKPNENKLNEECCQILERNHLTKQNLLNIYHLFNKNETIFLNWLRTIFPEYFLPLLLNYVKHFDSISTDNE